MYEWTIVYEAMTQVSHRPNILAYSYTSGVGGQGGHCPPPPSPIIQPGGGLALPIIRLYIIVFYYDKRLIVLI